MFFKKKDEKLEFLKSVFNSTAEYVQTINTLEVSQDEKMIFEQAYLELKKDKPNLSFVHQAYDLFMLKSVNNRTLSIDTHTLNQNSADGIKNEEHHKKLIEAFIGKPEKYEYYINTFNELERNPILWRWSWEGFLRPNQASVMLLLWAYYAHINIDNINMFYAYMAFLFFLIILMGGFGLSWIYVTFKSIKEWPAYKKLSYDEQILKMRKQSFFISLTGLISILIVALTAVKLTYTFFHQSPDADSDYEINHEEIRSIPGMSDGDLLDNCKIACDANCDKSNGPVYYNACFDSCLDKCAY